MNSKLPPLSHRVAVNGYVLFGDKFLLLKRETEPKVWGPPGGKLDPGEDPVLGLKREIREETGLEVQVHVPVTTWFGQYRGFDLLSVDYLCSCDSDAVILSGEHSGFLWISAEELEKRGEELLNYPNGFQTADFLKARQISRALFATK